MVYTILAQLGHGAGNAVARAVVGEDGNEELKSEESSASGTDMTATWLPRPINCCRGVHVAASSAR